MRQPQRRSRLRRELFLCPVRHISGKHEVIRQEVLAVLGRDALSQFDDVEHASVAIHVEGLSLLAALSACSGVARCEDPLPFDRWERRGIATDDTLLNIAQRFFLQADDSKESLPSLQNVGLFPGSDHLPYSAGTPDLPVGR